VQRLASDLKIDLREFWRPDTDWLASYQKIQLAHLLVSIKGPTYAPAPERKKSELVELLSRLFADGADGKVDEKQLSQKLLTWLPRGLEAKHT